MQQVEVGAILEGKITGVKKFGAFVRLPNGSTGMVHISEVSTEYIQELSDVLSEGQTVNVKVVSINEEGKIALSIKKAQPQQEGAPRPERGERPARAPRPTGGRADQGRVWQPKPQQNSAGDLSFEDMMAKFKSQSEEKISDLRRVTESHRGGGYSRRR